MPRLNKRPDESEIARLEELLQATFLPQIPRENYGEELQRRLMNDNAPKVEFPTKEINPIWIILASLGAMTMILLLLRAWLSLGGMRVIEQWRKQLRNEI